MKEVEVMKVIRTTLRTKGKGVKDDKPIRTVTEYWDMEGNLLVQIDPFQDDEVVDTILNTLKRNGWSTAEETILLKDRIKRLELEVDDD